MNGRHLLVGTILAFPIGLPVSVLAADITVTGSSTIAPILNEIARRYEESHPEARIGVQSGGSLTATVFCLLLLSRLIRSVGRHG